MKRNIDYKKTHPLKIFLSYYGPHKNLFILDMCCAFLICLIDLAFPYASRSALNNLLPNKAYHAFFVLVVSENLAEHGCRRGSQGTC